MMRKLLMLSAVTMILAGSVGCRCDWFRRGALLAPPVTVLPECAVPSEDSCDPCNSCAPGTGPGAGLPETLLPGPTTPLQ